jgi:AAA domain
MTSVPDELTDDEAFALVQSKIIDLSKIDTEQPIPWTVEGMAHEGTRVLLPGAKSEGKSLTALAVALDVAAKGEDFEVYYLDAENGRTITAGRKESILAARSPQDAGWARQGFYYSDTFDFRDLDDPALMAEWQKLLETAALVVVDSLPKYLGKLGLNENEAPHISHFFSTYIDQLIVNRRTTVFILDNVGHAGAHARGSTAKEDQSDTVYIVTGGQTCSEKRHGTITLRNKKHRVGDEADILTFGAGDRRYTSLVPDDSEAKLLEEVRALLTPTPQSKNWIYAQAKEKGVKVRKAALLILLDAWADEPYSGIMESLDGGFCLES